MDRGGGIADVDGAAVDGGGTEDAEIDIQVRIYNGGVG